MSKQANQKIVSPNISAESIDQPLDFGMCKIKGVTSLTLMGDPTVRSFGSRQPDFFYGLVHQIANASSKGESPDELGIKFMLAFVKILTPRDEIDAMLATQMAATHVAAVKYANRLAEAETLQEQDSA